MSAIDAADGRPPARESNGWAWFPLAGFTVLSGALQRPLNGGSSLAGDLHRFTRESNLPMMVVGLALYLAAILALVPRLRRTALPPALTALLGLNGWAVLSCLWSHAPLTTLVRSFGLTGASLVALASLALLGTKGVFGALGRFSALFIAANAVLAVLVPDYARHGADDFYAVHQGALRGSYAHKNEFAVYLALAVLMIALQGGGQLKQALSGRALFSSGPVRLALLAVGTVLLIGAHSAKVLIAVPVAFVAAMVASRVTPGLRLGLLGACAGAVLLGAGIFPVEDVWRAGLETLGRDPTLSARTVIWQAALRADIDDPLLGGGYAAAWDAGIGDAVRQVIGFDPGHPHNGYLAVFLDLGAPGLGLALMSLAVLGWRLLAINADRDPVGARTLTGLWVFTVLVNLSGTYLAQSNDLLWAVHIWMHALAAHLATPATAPAAPRRPVWQASAP